MYSSIMHDSFSIKLENVSKIYQLYGSQRDQLVDILGLERIGFKLKYPVKEHAALESLSLEVPKGHRIGILGRNGAGKTTLLKLLCGNFSPTSGKINVNGVVQALMTSGVGFHPEYTGRENAKASIQYNGLTKDEYDEAMEGIIDFCELDEYLDQPFKTYSLGMQTRLMFATSTAIKPDILIVDEVLGAGDAYFIAKSKRRLEKLVSTGCSMLLVSHAMEQILELCDEAIWLDHGRILMQGEAFKVVKAYEEFMHRPISAISSNISIDGVENILSSVDEDNLQKHFSNEEGHEGVVAVGGSENNIIFQEPVFNPHKSMAHIPNVKRPLDFNFITTGGISRWEGTGDLKVSGFVILSENGMTNKLVSLRPVKFIFEITAKYEREFSCRYSINISNHMGQTVCSIKSPKDKFSIKQNERRSVEVFFNPLQLGPGEYTVGIVILAYGSLELVNSAVRHDLLSRSFEFRVENPESCSALQNQFFHSAEWGFH